MSEKLEASLEQAPVEGAEDVDVSLIDYNLSLTVSQRIRQHDRALAMAKAFQRAGMRAHGIAAPGVAQTAHS
jgi:hypothetical protein